MVKLEIQIQQLGGYLVMQYHAAKNSTTSEIEEEEVKDLVATLQERVAKKNGAGKFVENTGAHELPDFPDFGQPDAGDDSHRN